VAPGFLIGSVLNIDSAHIGREHDREADRIPAAPSDGLGTQFALTLRYKPLDSSPNAIPPFGAASWPPRRPSSPHPNGRSGCG